MLWQLCLNPCCSGRWSRTSVELTTRQMTRGLNPCCSGRWSRTYSAGAHRVMRVNVS